MILVLLDHIYDVTITGWIVEAMVEMPASEISSSGIRSAVSSGKSVRYLVPRGVEKFIETLRIYRAAT